MIIFSSLLLVVCIILGGIAYQVSSNAMIQEIEKILPEKAYDAARLVEESIKSHVGMLEIITRNEAIVSMDWERQLPILRDELKKSEFLHLGISTVDGYLRFSNGEEIEVEDRTYFDEALKGKSVVSEPIVNKVDGSISIYFASPIYGESREILGILVAVTDETFLTKITNNIGFGEKGYAYMIDGEGTVISHRDRDLIVDQRNFIEEAKSNEEYVDLAKLLQNTIQGTSNVGGYHFRGNDIYMGTSPIKNTNWHIAVGSYKDEVLEGLGLLRRAFTFSTVIILAIGIAIVLIITRIFVEPIISIEASAKEIAALDIRRDLPEKLKLRKDEIGSLAIAFQSLVDSMRQVIKKVAESSNHMTSASQELTSISQESVAAADHVATSASEVTHNMDKQLKEIMNTISVITEISASMEEVSGNIQEISQLSTDTFNQSTTGKDEIYRMSLQMKEINNSTKEVKNALTNISNSSNEMNNIINLIKGIAEQTNLLALNAAIEAARAGKYGRGFAVVAEEVRKLAEESQRATEEIKHLIMSTQKDIHDANNKMEESIQKVEKGMEAVITTEKTFDTIATLIGEVNSQLEGITAAIEEVANGSQEMVASASAMESSAQLVAEEVQSVTAATEEQTASMEEIAAASGALAELADVLEHEIRKFKI